MESGDRLTDILFFHDSSSPASRVSIQLVLKTKAVIGIAITKEGSQSEISMSFWNILLPGSIKQASVKS